MITSIYLAKVIGLVLSVAGISMLMDTDRIERLMKDYLKNEALLFFSAIFGFTVSVLIIMSHNVWVSDWPVLITLVGWWGFVKTLYWLLLPQHAMKLTETMQQKSFIKFASVVSLALGLFLVYTGIMAV